jgi:hypothetical protein
VFEKTLEDEKLLLLRKVIALLRILSKTGDVCSFHHPTSVQGLAVVL